MRSDQPHRLREGASRVHRWGGAMTKTFYCRSCDYSTPHEEVSGEGIYLAAWECRYCGTRLIASKTKGD